MIFDCFQQVAHLSEAFTLEPGDVIATGTPAGVGAVRQPFPDGLLKVGDVVRVEIDGHRRAREPRDRGARGLRRRGGARRRRRGRPDRRAARVPRRAPVGVLATTRADGRPRQSVVYYVRDGDRLLISTRVEAAQGARRASGPGWASLCVLGDEQPYPVGGVLGVRRDPDRRTSAARRPRSCSASPDARAARAADRRGARGGRPGHPRDHRRAGRRR